MIKYKIVRSFFKDKFEEELNELSKIGYVMTFCDIFPNGADMNYYGVLELEVEDDNK